MKKPQISIALLLSGWIALLLTGCSHKPEFKSFPKIDAHIHIETADDSFIKVAKDYNFHFITLAYDGSSRANIDRQLAYSEKLHKEHPETVAFATTFSMEDFGKPGWKEKTIKQLKKDFDKGAVAVKVWKDIGMVFRNPDSSFIMLDDVRLDPIWDFIESQNKTVVNHTGEPKNCWLPLADMSVRGDSSYYAEYPQYHMYLHPDYPSYETILAARDRMLDKHPGLRYVACHLASLEWSVDEQAKFLDKYPKVAMDMASRIEHLKYQNSDKVRSFIIKYQDRLLYATDIEISDAESNESSAEKMMHYIKGTYQSDWDYFTTDRMFTQDDKVKEYKGLHLPVEVLKKIYYQNAIRMYPGLGFSK